MTFLNFRLSEEVEQGILGGPMFKTTVFPIESGFEQRNADWAVPLGQWDAGYGILDKYEKSGLGDAEVHLDLLKRIFYNMRGKAFSFMFKDWADFEIGYEQAVAVTPQIIALGDDSTVLFQLFKSYEITLLDSSPQTFFRPLTKFSDGAEFEIRLDGVLQTGGGTDYTMDFLRGLLTMNVAPASTGGGGPSGEEVLEMRANFFNHSRFDTDKLDLNMKVVTAGSWPSFPLMELRGTGLAAP